MKDGTARRDRIDGAPVAAIATDARPLPEASPGARARGATGRRPARLQAPPAAHTTRRRATNHAAAAATKPPTPAAPSRSAARATPRPTRSGRWRAIDRALRQLASRRASLDQEEARWLQRARAERLHRRLGYKTLAQYVECVLGHPPAAARERLRVAGALEKLPLLSAALASRAICYSVARELTRVASRDTEAAWLEAAANQSVRTVEDLVSGRRRGDLPGTPGVRREHPRAVQLSLDPATWASYAAARRAIEAELGHPPCDDEVIATLCAAYGNTTPPRRRRVAARVAVSVCRSCGQAELRGVPAQPLTPAELDRLTCGTRRSTTSAATAPPERARRDSATPATDPATDRSADAGCAEPGCDRRHLLEAHRVPGTSTKRTVERDRVVTLCLEHHRMAHEPQSLAGTAAPRRRPVRRPSRSSPRRRRRGQRPRRGRRRRSGRRG